MKPVLTLAVLIVFAGTVLSSHAWAGPDGSYRVAQAGSCRAIFNTCDQRCKTRLPGDKNCTTDHCTPKLSECRVTGCWQEGQLYGGAKTCGLMK